MINKFKTLFCCMYFLSANVNSQEIQTSQKNFSIELNATRVIFPEGAKSKSISAFNSQPHPVLIQSISLKEDLKTTGSYIITPPIVRLEPQQRSNLLIRLLSNEAFPRDKESMEWICVKGIPPKDDNEEKAPPAGPEVIVQISLNTCNKIFYRPDSLTVSPLDFYGKVKWQVNNGSITAKNESPFYINFNNVKYNEKQLIQFDYLAPFSEKTIKENVASRGTIHWNIVTDTGGISTDYKYEIRP
ncbi:TPA: fimbria/pilus periplasmic chaperone [Enterobacter asburiae]